jgi:hypothetical protein
MADPSTDRLVTRPVMRQQSTDCGGIHVVAARHLRLRLARLEPLKRLLPLVRRQLARTAELDATSLRSLLALAGGAGRRDVTMPILGAEPNHADRRHLARVDDRMQADIGLTRFDVRDALSEPIWRDPTSLLRARALERRRKPHALRAFLHQGSSAFRRRRLRPNCSRDSDTGQNDNQSAGSWLVPGASHALCASLDPAK